MEKKKLNFITSTYFDFDVDHIHSYFIKKKNEKMLYSKYKLLFDFEKYKSINVNNNVNNVKLINKEEVKENFYNNYKHSLNVLNLRDFSMRMPYVFFLLYT